MSTVPPPTRLTDRKRDAIVQAAIGEFREHGFNGTSMDRVAAAADVSKRTVYNHFPSKEALFEAILGHLWDRSQSATDIPYDAARPLRTQLLALLEQKMQLLGDASFIDLSRVAMAEIMHTPERAQAMVARLSEKEEGLPHWIRAAQDDSRLRPGWTPTTQPTSCTAWSNPSPSGPNWPWASPRWTPHSSSRCWPMRWTCFWGSTR